MFFESEGNKNGGEFPFLARGRTCNFFVGPTEAVLMLNHRRSHHSDVEERPPGLRQNGRAFTRAATEVGEAPRELRFEFVGANPAARVTGLDELTGKANYFLGRDPAQWRTSVPLFGRVSVAQIYPGVELIYYGNAQRLEYDFVVAPGADPSKIVIQFTGADQIQIDAAGELVFTLGRETIRQPKPVVYQTVRGSRKLIPGSYSLTAGQTVAFQLGEFDRELPLVIDPVLSYSTFYGGSGLDIARAVGVDTNGFVYVAGETTGALPTSPGTRTNRYNGSGSYKGDAFVAKFSNDASSLIYLSYLGGSADDVGLSLAVDDAGHAYVTGWTDSDDFPTTNAIQPRIGGQPYPGLDLYPIDGFVAKLGVAGTNLIYSTYLGGDLVDEGVGIAVDRGGAAYVTGYTESTNFPTLNTMTGWPFGGGTNYPVGSNYVEAVYFYRGTNYHGNGDAFLTKISPSGTNSIYSLFLGGTNQDAGSGVAANAAGLAFVTGSTRSPDFPIFPTNQFGLASGLDAFVTIIGATGTNPVFSTFLGGSGDNAGYRIALDAASQYYVTGTTQNDPSFPITPSTVNPGGVFRSENAAANWIPASHGLQSVVVSAVAIDPQTPTRLYAATGRGVARSLDGGANWNSAVQVRFETEFLTPAVAVGLVSALAIDPATPSTIYAGTSLQGVYRSSDAGTTWSLSNTGLLNLAVSTIAVDPHAPAILYVGTSTGVFKSTNSASHWSAINNGLNSVSVKALTIHPTRPTTIYAASSGGVFRSTDGGGAWMAFNSGLSNLFVQAIAIDPATPATLYAGTLGGVFKTINAGTNWSEINAGLTTTNVTCLAIDPSAPETVYAGTANGLFKSSDGGTNWSRVTNGLSVTSILALAVNPLTPATLYAGSGGTSYFGGEDVFLFKSGPEGYSAVLGGARNDEGWDVAVDAAAHAHLVGVTYSTNFPTQNAAGFLRATNAGGADAFVAEFSAGGDALVKSAYLGGASDDLGYGIALDAVGNVYFVGETSSTNFPTLAPGQSAFGGNKDAFLAKLLGNTAPTLRIALVGSEVTLSWPPYWPEFSVQTSTDVAETNGWSPLGIAPIQTNGAFHLPLGTTNAASFFRLRHELPLGY